MFKNVKVISMDQTLLEANLTFDPDMLQRQYDSTAEVEVEANRLMAQSIERLRHMDPEKTLYLYVDGELKSTLEPKKK